MRCECGCGWEGEDEVTQWLVQEAAFAALEELLAPPAPSEDASVVRRPELEAMARRAMGAIR